MLEAIESPNSFTAVVWASKACTGALPARSSMACLSAAPGTFRLGLRVKSAVDIS
jgi:hypothetical protein